MSPTLPVLSRYEKLIAEIVRLFKNAQKAFVHFGWQTGRYIIEIEQDGAARARYGAGILAAASKDLTRECGKGFSKTNLKRFRRFFRLNPKGPPVDQLPWSHHIELMPVPDAQTRKSLEEKAIREVLSRDDVRKLVHAELVREEVAANLVRSEDEVPYGSPNRQLLEPVRGTLYAYRIFQPTSLDKSSKTRQVVVGAKATTKLVGETDSELLIDLGFSSYKDLGDVTSRGLKPDDIVESVRTGDGQYSVRKLDVSSLPVPRSPLPAALYTYKAEVEKVVDGDTLRVVVDLGFGFKTRQYLRLRGLDCPEMDTPEGKKASDFVKARIRIASEIVLTSSRSDKYDRYLADVYYVDAKGKEVYLNNTILENGYAVRVQS